jgi:RNA polymerase sigma factor (sigma-70 family)
MHSLAQVAPTRSESPPFAAVTDAQAVNEVLAGNREMFEVIVRRYNAQLYRVGMAYVRGHAATEDAMQNAYLKAFLNLNRFQGTASFGTWLTRIMINECLMILRRQKRFKVQSLDSLENEPATADTDSFALPAADPVNAQEMKALLEQALQNLPRTHRAVYLLREVQHLSTAETAECLGVSRDNVKVCLHRAREGLKAEILKSSAGVELFAYPATYCEPMTAKVMAGVLSMPPLVRL